MYEQSYRDFCNAAGLRYQLERAQMYGFTRSIAQKKAWAVRKDVDKYARVRYNADGTIVVTDKLPVGAHGSAPKTLKPNAVLERESKQGRIERTIYDENSKQAKQVHASDHGNPKRHPYGEHGEHTHDVSFEGGKIARDDARELTAEERNRHRDIL
jgi:hypothetical protein